MGLPKAWQQVLPKYEIDKPVLPPGRNRIKDLDLSTVATAKCLMTGANVIIKFYPSAVAKSSKLTEAGKAYVLTRKLREL